MTEVLYENPYAQIAKAYPNCYIASWSAAEYWNIIDELPRDIILFSKDTEETKRLEDLTLQIKKVPEKFFFDLETQETIDGLFYISSPTKTLIDCFAYPDWAGGIRQVDYIFSLYAESNLYNPSLLLKLAKKVLSPEKISHILKLIQEAKL